MKTRDRFEEEKRNDIVQMGRSARLQKMGMEFLEETVKYRYSYHFTWLGRPIIQYPQDIVAMQEIIWDVKPDLIIETGIARGGSLIFYASLLELLGKGTVVGIDIDIRAHNRKAIQNHKLSKRITMIEGSSTDEKVVGKVAAIAKRHSSIFVCLDSLHTHEHVLQELKLYSPFVTKNSYLVVFDTGIEYMTKGFFKDRLWDKGNNPKTAVDEFLKHNKNFALDRAISDKLLITAAPGGYLLRIR